LIHLFPLQRHVEADPEAAVSWLRQACGLGAGEPHALLAYCIEVGTYVPWVPEDSIDIVDGIPASQLAGLVYVMVSTFY
jgi:TPR repeat protein